MILLSSTCSTSNSSWSLMISGGGGGGGKGVRRRKGELDDGEDGMEAAHGEREFELVGSMANAQSDFEWPETSMGQFCGQSSGANIARV